MEPNRLLTIDFRIEFDHYAEASLHTASGVYVCRCLDYNDGLGLLARQAAGILRHPLSQGVATWEMNGQTWWVMSRTGDSLSLSLLDFRETQQDLPGGDYVTVYVFERIAFHASLGFRDFIRELTRAFEAIEQSRVFEVVKGLGPQTYKSAWGWEFPREALDRLHEFLRQPE